MYMYTRVAMYKTDMQPKQPFGGNNKLNVIITAFSSQPTALLSCFMSTT